MENFEKCTVAMLGGPCSQHVTGNTSWLNQLQSAIMRDKLLPEEMSNNLTHIYIVSLWSWLQLSYTTTGINDGLAKVGTTSFVKLNSDHSELNCSWWRHQMEIFSALLAFCAGNSPVTGAFHAQRPLTRSFDVPFDLHLNQQLSKQWRRRWFETPSRSLWSHCNVDQIETRALLFVDCAWLVPNHDSRGAEVQMNSL